MADRLIDTDVFIDHFRGARTLTPARGMHYSVITRCELFAGRRIEGADIRELLDGLREVPISRSIAEAAGRLRRDSGIQTPDALIAATALAYSMELVTRNLRDFSNIPGLVVSAPA